MIATRETTPFLLAGTAPTLVIAAGVPTNGMQLFPASSLANPFNVPLEVTEINFLTSLQWVSGVSWTTAIDLQLRFGRFDMTNGFVPLFCVAPTYDTATKVEVFMPAFAGPLYPFAFRWVFPRPAILMPGAALTGAVRIAPGIAPGSPDDHNVVVSMSVRARKCPAGTPTPKTTCVPFVSGGFLPTANVAVANNLAFMNTLDKPLNVTSFNMHNAAICGSAGPLLTTPVGNWTIVGPGGALGTPRRTITDGRTGAGVFAQRSSIEVSHVLLPRESYLVTTDTPTGMAAISGYREEAL